MDKNIKRLGFMKFSYQCELCSKETEFQTQEGNLDSHARDIVDKRYSLFMDDKRKCLCQECYDKNYVKPKYNFDYNFDYNWFNNGIER